MSPDIALIIGAVLALIGTIVLYCTVMPKRKEGQLTGFAKFLHNYFHFKQLFIEAVLKFFFVFASLCCIGIGFFMLFSSVRTWGGSRSLALYGLILMVVGPIAMRFVYEMMMMFILLVQNVIDINKKMGPMKPSNAADAPYQDPYQDQYQYAQYQQPQNKTCAYCGAQCNPDTVYCPNCGNRV